MKTDQRTSASENLLAWDCRDSPVGVLTVFVSERGIRALLWENESATRVRVAAEPVRRSTATSVAAFAQLGEYFAGDRQTFDLPLDPVGSDFHLRAWEALRGIPYGETLSYGEQARRLGDVALARAVGSANGKNPISIIVPCHRVIGSNGSLTGFAGGLDAKRLLLTLEGAACVAEPSERTPAGQEKLF
jgi:methylated-DNA-[protein]-cysteine S-methyltransferase